MSLAVELGLIRVTTPSLWERVEIQVNTDCGVYVGSVPS